MRNLFIKTLLEGFILLVLIGGVILFMAMFTAAAAQGCIMTQQPQKATKWTISKDGTVATKTCVYWLACPNMDVVEFRATNTSVVTLYKYDDKLYHDANEKKWVRYEEDGLIVFQCDKKAFYYKP